MADSGAAVEHADSGVRAWLIPRPGLFELLGAARRVVHVSAPAGSGKTFLLRAWIAAEGLSERTAWVSVGRQERDPQVFWLSVLDSLRQTGAGSERVRELTAAPDLDGANVVARLLEDLSSLQEPLWLVIDDLQELHADHAIRDMELLLGTAPPELRFVLLTRHDLRLGLHRLRVEGELTELRGEDLRFTLEESRALLEAAEVRLSDGALESVVATTEGWAAGLRLVALSLARHPDRERYAVSFSGRERAVADYLLAEVLERQSAEVRQLLLRTSLLERVSGPLADRLTGGSGSYRILAGLEDAGAFVVAVDPERTWFRYHHLFGDLLTLELRRTAPQELPGLHTIAAEWLAEHGHPIEAIRHSQAAENWGLAARLLADNWFPMYLDGRLSTARGLLAEFPRGMVVADAELAVLAAEDKNAAGALEEAERYLSLAASLEESVPEARRGRFRGRLARMRVVLARARNDPEAVADEAQRLLRLAENQSAGFEFREDLQIAALIDLGTAELWAGRPEEAEQHLERGLAEARRVGRPWLELQALSQLAIVAIFRRASSHALADARAREAIDLAREHGWEETATAVATAKAALASGMLWRARLQDAEEWLDSAERVLTHSAQPATAVYLHRARALLERARGRPSEAMAASQDADADRIEQLLATPHILAVARAQSIELQTLVNDDPQSAVEALAPVLDGSSPWAPRWEIQALLVEAIARDALGDLAAGSRALERALDMAEPEGLRLPFLLFPAPALLERHRRLRTSHASLIAEILNLLSGQTPAPRPEDAAPLREPLSESELRVLRYLPTNLPAPEIAAELFVSLNTIRTHLRHVYAKLGVHSRADAVKRARELGLLSHSSLKR